MIIPKKSRVAVYSYLLKEGVMVAKKEMVMTKHQDVEVPNLYVLRLMDSMKARGLVQEQYNWGWFYWFLTNDGIEYLRNYLNLPAEIVPATLKKPRAPPRSFGMRRDEGGDRPPRAFPSGGYDKKGDRPSGAFAPSFRGAGRGGSFGRGGGRREGGYRRDPGREAPSGGGFGRGRAE